MKYKVDGWNNFCRVFELPKSYPSGFCFDGGKPVNILMVDWFNPVCDIPQPAVSKEVWKDKVGEIKVTEIDLDELENTLIPFLKNKQYVKSGRTYLVLYDFGGATTFIG
jgi:hypothetical protein